MMGGKNKKNKRFFYVCFDLFPQHKQVNSEPKLSYLLNKHLKILTPFCFSGTSMSVKRTPGALLWPFQMQKRKRCAPHLNKKAATVVLVTVIITASIIITLRGEQGEDQHHHNSPKTKPEVDVPVSGILPRSFLQGRDLLVDGHLES